MLPTESQAKEAQVFMAAEVVAPAFFEKLASYDIRPRNEAEAQQLLQLGASLYAVEQQGQYKTAAAQSNEQGNPFLDLALQQLTPAQRPTPQQFEGQLKQAALQVVQNDAIAKQAALVYAHCAAGGQVVQDAAA